MKKQNSSKTHGVAADISGNTSVNYKVGGVGFSLPKNNKFIWMIFIINGQPFILFQ